MQKKGKILIIDDVEINRTMLRDVFEEEFDVLEADDGLSGLGLVRQHSGELKAIFLDIIMPEVDGFTVLQELEDGGLMKKIPVFLITTETSEYVVGNAYKYGVVDVIPKPFDMKIITRRVKNFIELFELKRNQEAFGEG